MDVDVLYSAEQIKVPERLGEVLKEYTKAVIRASPSDILKFSANYFATKANLPSAFEEETEGVKFARLERDSKKPLPRKSVGEGDLRRAVLTKKTSMLEQVKKALSIIDTNEDGVMQVEEMLNVFYQVISMNYPGGKVPSETWTQIKDHLERSFKGADTDRSGTIDPEEFLKAAEDPDHPLSIIWDILSS